MGRHIIKGSYMDKRADLVVMTYCNQPPIPYRGYDWSAVPDNYEPGLALGYGHTEQEAIANLLEQLGIDTRDDVLADYREACKADWQRTGE